MTDLASFLPVEILQHIFSLAQYRDFASIEYGQIIDNARLAAIVAHVCQHWRAAALGLPALWVFICDDDPDSWDEYMERSDHLPLAFAASRAARHSTHVAVPVADPKRHFVASNALPKSTERVHMIALRMTPSNCPFAITDSPSSFLNPHNLSVFSSWSSFDAWRATKVPSQNCFSALKNLHLEGAEFPAGSVFPRLETISANDILIPMQSMIIPSALTLTHITFGAGVHYLQWPSTRVVLPVLKTLTLNNTPIPIAEWLSTPALEVLRFQRYTKERLWYIDFSGWKQKPLVMLSELTLHVCEEVPDIDWNDDMPDMFAAFSNVRRVRLDVPSDMMVSYLGSYLNDHVWTGLTNISVWVGSKNAYQDFLEAMPKTNKRELVKPWL